MKREVKKKIGFCLLSVVIIISFVFLFGLGGYYYFIFMPTRELASFAAEYRKDAEIMNEEREEDPCDLSENRTRIENDSNMDVLEGFDLMRVSFENEYDCYSQVFGDEYIFIEDKMIELREINTKYTSYDEDSEELAQALEDQIPFVEAMGEYNEGVYAIEISYIDCKEFIYTTQIDLEGYFKEGFSEETIGQEVENCNDEYFKAYENLDSELPEFEALSEKHSEAQEISRTITKRLNIALNE